MTILAIVLALTAVPAAFTIWVRLDKADHFIYGALAGGATHAGLTILAYLCWNAT
jgi:hypothetical protein